MRIVQSEFSRKLENCLELKSMNAQLNYHYCKLCRLWDYRTKEALAPAGDGQTIINFKDVEVTKEAEVGIRRDIMAAQAEIVPSGSCQDYRR